MLANILDVEESMIRTAVEGENGWAFLLRHGGCFSFRRAGFLSRVFSQTWLAPVALEHHPHPLPRQ